MTTWGHLSDEQLTDEITTWAGRVAAGEARLLALVAELDRREAWAGPGLLSCAHWLSWRLGLGLTAARERVRVARALLVLPRTTAAYEAGQVSWSQVRATTRVATAEDEQTYLDMARHATGAQLERVVRGVRRARRLEEDAADPELAAHRMRTRTRYDEDGTLVLTVRLPAEDGAAVLAALEQARADLDAQRRAEASAEGRASGERHRQGASSSSKAEEHRPRSTPEPSAEDPGSNGAPRATVTDALLHLTGSYLDRVAAERPAAVRRGRARLVAQVDPVSGWARLRDGELLPPTSLRAVLRSLPGRGHGLLRSALQLREDRLRPLQPADLTRHDLGRTARLPGLAPRELLGTLDGERCRFPGCVRTRRLHAHHVTSWGEGGRTDLDNLVLVCARHHTLVHREHFALRLHADRRLTVHTADGVPVLHHPGLPWGEAASLDRGQAVRPDTLPPATSGQRLDLHYAVAVLLQQAA